MGEQQSLRGVPHERWHLGVIGIVVGYPLSVGPVAWLCKTFGPASRYPAFVEQAYAPLRLLHEALPPVRQFDDWDFGLFGIQGTACAAFSDDVGWSRSMIKVTSFTKDVPEFLRVVGWCYEEGLGWVIAASCRDGEMAIHLDLPDSDVRARRFKQLVDGQPSWTVVVEAESQGDRVATGQQPDSESLLQ